MTDRKSLEREIRHLVATTTDGTQLSNSLLSPPDGLFCKLGSAVAEREAVVNSELYRVAQDRIHDLLDIEYECFAQARVEIARLAQALPIRGLQAVEANH